MRLGFAGAGHTAAVQHARFPLAYPEEAGKRLALSQSMPTLHEIRSKALAPVVGHASAGSVGPVMRGGESLTGTQRDRTVRGIRDRLDSSMLSDALKLDLRQKLESATEKYESAKSMQENTRRDAGRYICGEYVDVDDSEAIDKVFSEEPLAGQAENNEDRSSRSERIKQRSSDPAIPFSQSQVQKDHRLLVQPLILPVRNTEICPFEVDLTHQQVSVESNQISQRRRPERRAHTVTGGWRCTDRQRANGMTAMRATWLGSLGPGSRGKSQAISNRMIDWSVAWLDHPEDGGLASRQRSRSPSPQDDKPVKSSSSELSRNSSSADFSRNFNVLLPPMHELSPMLLTGAEHKKVDVNKLTPLPGSPDLRVSTSGWRLRTLFDKSLAHAVRG